MSSAAAAPPTDNLHARATALFEEGRLDEAVVLLREAVAAALEPDLVNDLAVLLAQAGGRDEARDLLVGLRRLAPGHEAAQENLAALGDAPASGGAVGATHDMTEVRARFLQLALDARATHLADNVDHLFAPWGAEPPAAADAGTRLAAQVDVLERCAPLWRAAGDDATRELLLRLLAYRALGPAHVRLQMEPAPYRRAVVALSAQMLERAGVIGAPGLPLEWQFHEYDLTKAGHPLRILGQPLPLASTFLFSQYAHRDPAVPARPRPGDVAVDAGGCWGDTALWLAHAVGRAGRVHTFEPSPRNRELLQRNLDLNPELAGQVTVWGSPLGSRAGEPVWIPNALAAGATMQEAPGAGQEVELRLETIDALVARGDLERVDFLKVDVEGADLGVLEGASQTIRAQRPTLAIAIYHRPDDLAVIPAFVASLGVEYRWYLQCSTMTDVDTVAFAVPA